MGNQTFAQVLASGRTLVIDGGMGTMLQAAGMAPGQSPELYCLANTHVLLNIQEAYARAGANIITTCTFGANSFKLPEDADVFSINKQLATLARKASGARHGEHPVFVAGDVGPSGHFLRPLGELEPDQFVKAYMRQIEGLVAGGVDLIFVETQFDLSEARAIVYAARQVCDLPVMVSMTFEKGVSLTGSSPLLFAYTMLNMSVDALGTNCSLGPDEMGATLDELLKSPATHLLAEPNAGLPQLVDGKTIFPMDPASFAKKTASFVEKGIQIVGGCCGTTPDHIRLLVEEISRLPESARVAPEESGIVLTTRSTIVRAGVGHPLAIIGERINPTGKPALAESLREGDFSIAIKFADEQLAAGVSIIDVNVGAPLIDEALVLPALVTTLGGRIKQPLSLDSSSNLAIAKALPYCAGSALVNSISGEADRMEFLGPLCRDWGAPFILLPLMEGQLPVTARERIAITEKLLLKAESLKIPRSLVLVDILALSISSEAMGAQECMKMLKWCVAEKLPSTIGLSNISFGLPARALVNSVFLCIARGAGLSSCIANPSLPRISEAVDSIRLLEGYDPHAESFIDRYASWKTDGIAENVKREKKENSASLYDAVVNGDLENVEAFLENEISSGTLPLDIVNNILIPAITEVGERYERKEYFLPQLVRGAETMQKAFAQLNPLLEATRGAEKRPVIVMATVEGDIHDIGKNIVGLLLGNHGFDVIDAGKNVRAEDIVACAEKHGAHIIGLSALMTTTMVRMEDTIRLVREKGLPIKIMVGGAAVTEQFASSIGADAYCEDAVESVKTAEKFLREMALCGKGSPL